MITARSAALTMPAVALRGLVVFPGANISFDVGRSKSVLAIKAAMTDNQNVFLVTQKDVRDSDPDYDQLYKTGTIARINHIVRVPNTDTFRISVEGVQRAKLISVAVNDRYLICDVKPKSDSVIKPEDHDYSMALVRHAKDQLEQYAEYAPQLRRRKER